MTEQLLLESPSATALPAAPRSRCRLNDAAAGPRANLELTSREREVLGELVRGHTNQGIAENLGMSPMTVKLHTGSVYCKLGVRRAEAVAHALRNGLVA